RVEEGDCEKCEKQEQYANHQIAHDVLVDAVRVFLMLGGILRDIGRVVHGSKQIKKRKNKNPDKIDEVPEEAGHLDSIGQVLGIALVNFFADRQPHVNEDEHPAQHVQTMQTGNGKVARKIGAVCGQK